MNVSGDIGLHKSFASCDGDKDGRSFRTKREEDKDGSFGKSFGMKREELIKNKLMAPINEEPDEDDFATRLSAMLK